MANFTPMSSTLKVQLNVNFAKSGRRLSIRYNEPGLLSQIKTVKGLNPAKAKQAKLVG